MQALGVDLLRLSPQPQHMAQVIALFECAASRQRRAGKRRILPLMPDLCNGFWHGARPGTRPQRPAHGTAPANAPPPDGQPPHPHVWIAMHPPAHSPAPPRHRRAALAPPHPPVACAPWAPCCGLPAYPGSVLLVTALNLALARHLPADAALLRRKLRH